MNDERSTIKITLPPPPEGATGWRLYRAYSETVYPWWLPSWIVPRLPGPLWLRARRLGHERPRYTELSWQEFTEDSAPVAYPDVALDCRTDRPPTWNDA